ncbi:PP2C family serine/threonine-protein phosphatase [Spirillospora sp. CA-253888]
MPSPNPGRWQVVAESVQGPGKPANQDRHGHWVSEDGARALLVVADGHGARAHPRSDVGAELAVAAFLDVAGGFCASLPAETSLKRLKFRAEEDLPRDLVRAWRARVAEHLRAHPVPDAPPASGEVGAEELTMYGSTLIGALLTPGLILAWQLGDGDFCLAGHDGAVATPLDGRGPVYGDETDSLCTANAHRLVRMYWAPQAADAAPPGLVALSTDGLSNSFLGRDGHLEFVADVHRLVERNGIGKVGAELPAWLERASSFSGDDTTFVAAWFGPSPEPEAVADPPPAPDPEPEPGPTPAPEIGTGPPAAPDPRDDWTPERETR